MSQESIDLPTKWWLLDFRIGSHSMDFTQFIDAEMLAEPMPLAASASFYCGVGRLITMEELHG